MRRNLKESNLIYSVLEVFPVAAVLDERLTDFRKEDISDNSIMFANVDILRSKYNRSG